MSTGAYRVAIVAGETFGDQLGAALIAALRARCSGISVRGVCGPLMRESGCEPLAAASELSVMGLAEVLVHLPRLLRLRGRLRRQLCAWRPDVFVGIDAPEFNLGLAHNWRRSRPRQRRAVHQHLRQTHDREFTGRSQRLATTLGASTGRRTPRTLGPEQRRRERR